MEYIITFSNTNSAIKAEQLLLAEQLRVGVLPLPGQIRAGCGICLRLPTDQIRPALEVLNGRDIAQDGLYARTEGDEGFMYQEITDRSAI